MGRRNPIITYEYCGEKPFSNSSFYFFFIFSATDTAVFMINTSDTVFFAVFDVYFVTNAEISHTVYRWYLVRWLVRIIAVYTSCKHTMAATYILCRSSIPTMTCMYHVIYCVYFRNDNNSNIILFVTQTRNREVALTTYPRRIM